jgi:NDP-sugar pyrophosphorylase family protein
MINIIVLAAGGTHPDDQDGGYPLCLAEMEGISVLERLVGACAGLAGRRFIFAFREDDVRRHHLDQVVQMLAPGSTVLSIAGKTRGSGCTALLAATRIEPDSELLVLNGDSLVDVNFREVIENFSRRGLTAGTITFPSLHPRYSYVRLDERQLVVEAAEKKPISRHATAGFYWYARGRDFVRATQAMIRKDAQVDGMFFICPALNELVLEHCEIGVYPVEARQYHQLKTARQRDQFEASLELAR